MAKYAYISLLVEGFIFSKPFLRGFILKPCLKSGIGIRLAKGDRPQISIHDYVQTPHSKRFLTCWKAIPERKIAPPKSWAQLNFKIVKNVENK